jgi:uncharacterized protein
MSGIDHEPENEEVLSTEGRGERFVDIIERRLSRRAFLKSVVAGTVVVGAGAVSTTRTANAQDGKFALSFSSIAPSKGPGEVLAEGHAEQVLIRWGDPILPGAPAFNPDTQSAAA